MIVRTELCGIILTLATVIHITSGSTSESRTIRIPFLEEQPEGTEVCNLKEGLISSQLDEVYFKMLSQRLTSGIDSTDDTAWVALDPNTGLVTVNTPVDREQMCDADDSQPCVIYVKIVRKPQRYYQMINLELSIKDINDHAPVFPVTPVISINVSESAPLGSKFSLDRYLATDDDVGRNKEIVYIATSSDYFGIHQFKDETGAPHLELVVAEDLDHELMSSTELTLTASNRGTPTMKSQVTLRVGILDANDNAPIFEKTLYSLNLRENLPRGEVIATVLASDLDSGKFGEIRYFVPSSGNTQTAKRLIRVDPISGRVMLKQALDREKHHNIQVVIGARDQGREGKTGKTTLEIRVADVNDNSPDIQVNIIVDDLDGTAYVSESANIGLRIAEINVNDLDMGLNGEVTTEISVEGFIDGRSTDFSPNAGTIQNYFSLGDLGLLTTGFSLNREDIPMFVVRITACDRGTPARCSEQNLTVKILDENDHSPVFVHPVKTYSLREDATKGTRVIQMTATDEDAVYLPAMRTSKTKERTIENSTNGEVTYEMHGGEGCFSINPKNGIITLVGAPDYESKKLWKLTITAKDGGNPPRSTNTVLDMHIIDINDNSPVFTMPAVSNSTFYATVQSDNVVIKINAVDYDQGTHSDVWYSLVSDNGVIQPKTFILNQLSGDFRLNLSNPKLSDMLGLHTIVVKAQDLGSPPLKTNIIFFVKVTNLPYAQLIRNTEPPRNQALATGDITVILIASLASATVLLVLILTGVVVRCKRENKEIRTYNCRSAESKKGLHPSPHGGVVGDIVVSSSNHLTASRDSNLNSVWNPNYDKSLASHPHILIKSNSVSTLSQRTLDRKMNSFSRREAKKAVLPQVPVADGDSGRGESDQDTGSFEGKDPVARDASHAPTELSNSVVVMDIPDAGSMGPLCTNICRQYGHSDACWMHVLDDQGQNEYGNDQQINRPTTPSYSYYTSQNFVNSRGLETISETQPLHSVLDTATDGRADDYVSESSRMVAHDSHAPALYSGHEYNPDTSYTMPRYYANGSYNSTPSHQYPHDNYTTTSLSHSASDLFHDGMYPAHVTSGAYYVASPGSCHHGNSDYVMTSRVASPTTVQSQDAALKRRSTASLHGELLHRRFIAAAQNGSSRADNLHSRAQTPAECGEVSMEETQQIIDDIDQLIDH